MDKYDTAFTLEKMLQWTEDGIKFKEIPGYDGKYLILSTGEVWSKWGNCYIAICDNGQGYLFVSLSQNNKNKRVRIHRLVAEAFIPKPDWWTPGMNLDVGHKDDNPKNNNVDNLYWCTRAQNLNTEHFREAQKNKQFTKVRCVETGEVFKNMRKAAEAIGKHYYGINLCLLGKQQTCGGYHWERVIEEPQVELTENF